MKKIVHITLKYDDGTEHGFGRDSTKWLLIATDLIGFNQISLSGDPINDSYLLRILENAVVQTMNKENRYGESPPEGHKPYDRSKLIAREK